MLAGFKFKALMYNLLISYTNSFFGFAIFIMLARLLNADDYSMVAIGVAAGGFIAPLLDLGAAKTFVRDAVSTEDSSEIDKLVVSNINMRISVAFIVIFCLFIFSFLYMDEFEKALNIVVLSLWAGVLGLYPTSWFDYKHKTSSQNLCVLFERFIVLILIGLFLLVDVQENILLISLLLLLTRIASISYQVRLWLIKYSSIKFSFKFTIPRMNSAGVNIFFTIALLSNALLTYGNQLIYGKSGDASELSAYSLSFQLISLIFLFQSQAIRVLNRDISETNKTNDNVKILRHLFLHCIFIMIVSAIFSIIIFYMSDYVPLLLGDKRFEAISKFMPILCVWIVIVGAGQVITQYLLEIKEEYFYLRTSVLSGLIAFILGVIFIPEYGAISIALILIVVHVFSISVNTSRLLYMKLYKSKVIA